MGTQKHRRAAAGPKWLAAAFALMLVGGLAASGLAAALDAGAAAGVDAPSNGAGWPWHTVSGIQAQVLEPEQAGTLVVDLLPAGASFPLSYTRPKVPAGAAANSYLPAEHLIEAGFYSARVSSDRRVGLIVRSDDLRGRATALYRQAQPGRRIVVPLVVKRYRGQSSHLIVQNADAKAHARFGLRLVPLGGAIPTRPIEVDLPPAGASRLDLALDPRFDDLPDGFVGHAVIDAADAAEVAVVSQVDVAGAARGIYALEGQPVAAAAARLVMPRLIHLPPRVSGVAVINVGTALARVDLRYHDAEPSAVSPCGAAATWPHQPGPIELAPGQQTVFYVAAPAPDGSGPVLPVGCRAWAEILSDGSGLLAAVVEAELNLDGSPSRAAAYSAIPEPALATELYLPLFRRQHTAMGLSTPFHIVNPGLEPASVRVAALDAAGDPLPCGLGCQLRLPAGSGGSWQPDRALAPDPRRRDGLFGSAVVTSDRPIAVVAYDEPRAAEADFGAYDALRASDARPGEGGRRYWILAPELSCLSPRSSSDPGCQAP